MDVSSEFVSPGEACKVLGVCHETLRRWSTEGKIRFVQAGPYKFRRYDISSVIKPIASESSETNEPERADIIYARVSTRNQRKFLENQSSRLVAKYGEHCTVVTDIGSGLNFKRSGLNKILEKVVRGKVRNLYVSHKDRLCRFAFDLVDFVCTRHGTTIVVAENGDQKTPESELAEDVLSIITVFGARLYGGRGKLGKGKRQRSHEEEDPIERKVAKLQDEDVSNIETDQGIEDMVCSWEASVQQGNSSDGEERPTIET
jgi:excisionase family DNA binding protein